MARLQLGEFEIRHELGRGSFGAVDLAVHRPTGAQVVIKRQTGTNATRAAAEARLMRSMCHRHVVSHIGDWESVDQHGGYTVVHIAMAYAPGGTLKDYLRRTFDDRVTGMTQAAAAELRDGAAVGSASDRIVGLPPALVAAWLAQLASALFYCHAQHVLHRDLKAENVLLDRPVPVLPPPGHAGATGSPSSGSGGSPVSSGGGGTPVGGSRTPEQREFTRQLRAIKAALRGGGGALTASEGAVPAGSGDVEWFPSALLSDFGLSRALGGTGDFAQTRLGTPQYLAPEVFAHAPYNNRADMWALGCVLYELLTLRRPFSGRTMPELVSRISRSPPRPFSAAVRAAYPPALLQLCTRLLSKDPRQRPAAREVLADPALALVAASPLAPPMPAVYATAADRDRERAAWARICLPAAYPRSTLLALKAEHGCRVNLRAAPKLDAPVLAVLLPGDVIETVEQPALSGDGTAWHVVADGGFCVTRSAAGDLFRPLPEWRIQRPGASAPPPPLRYGATTASPPSAPTADAAAVVAKVLDEAAAASDGRRRAALLRRFLQRQGVDDDRALTLLQCYRDLLRRPGQALAQRADPTAGIAGGPLGGGVGLMQRQPSGSGLTTVVRTVPATGALPSPSAGSRAAGAVQLDYYQLDGSGGRTAPAVGVGSPQRRPVAPLRRTSSSFATRAPPRRGGPLAAVGEDDTQWTLLCREVLLRDGLVHCIPVLRALARTQAPAVEVPTGVLAAGRAARGTGMQSPARSIAPVAKAR